MLTNPPTDRGEGRGGEEVAHRHDLVILGFGLGRFSRRVRIAAPVTGFRNHFAARTVALRLGETRPAKVVAETAAAAVLGSGSNYLGKVRARN